MTRLANSGISILNAGSGPNGTLRGLEGGGSAVTENAVTTGPLVQNGSSCRSYEGERGRMTRFEEGRLLIPKREPNRPDGDFVEDIGGRRAEGGKRNLNLCAPNSY